jgi:hypothetical protein
VTERSPTTVFVRLAVPDFCHDLRHVLHAVQDFFPFVARDSHQPAGRVHLPCANALPHDAHSDADLRLATQEDLDGAEVVRMNRDLRDVIRRMLLLDSGRLRQPDFWLALDCLLRSVVCIPVASAD